MTCVQNWWFTLLEADETSTRNNCSESQPCRTFAEVYGDGRTLCNTIWDTGYVYSEDENNCAVFAYDEQNSQLIPVSALPPDSTSTTTLPITSTTSGGSFYVIKQTLLAFCIWLTLTFKM
jgi:hypothetical protein